MRNYFYFTMISTGYILDGGQIKLRLNQIYRIKRESDLSSEAIPDWAYRELSNVDYLIYVIGNKKSVILL